MDYYYVHLRHCTFPEFVAAFPSGTPITDVNSSLRLELDDYYSYTTKIDLITYTPKTIDVFVPKGE